MKKQRSLLYHITIFIFAQVAWFSLLTLWIYRFVTTNVVMDQAGENLMVSGEFRVFTLISGIVLFVAVSLGMSLLFRRLNVQYNMTRMYDNFIANITHELKSPLASIQLYLETLQIRKVDRKNQEKFLQMMCKDALRLQRLINSILEISGLEQKRTMYMYDVFTADAMIRPLLNNAVDQFNLPPDALKIEGRAPCQCVADRDAMKIVFDNLIDNAIKYTTDQVKITVSMECTSKWIQISFRDEGIGIESGDQKVIFQKFQRIYRRDIPSVKGTGLGLYWVREIIRYHGGKITVHSKGRGQGTLFVLELPIYMVSRKKHINQLLRLTQRRKKEHGVETDREPV